MSNRLHHTLQPLVVFFFLSMAVSASAQIYPQWEGFPPMFSMNDIIEFKGRIYGVCDTGFFRYDPLTKDYTLFYKNHGLEAKNVLAVAATSNELFVGFKTDGLMRFDTEKDWFEPILFPEYVNEDVLKTIAVNDIYALNDSILFIAHSKGVDRLNLNSEEIRSFTKLSVTIEEDTPVNEVKVFKNKIWACTSVGLAWADFDNPNLESEENWSSYRFPAGVNSVLHYVDDDEDVILVGTDGSGIYKFDNERRIKESTLVGKSHIYDLVQASGTCFAAGYEGLFQKSVGGWFFVSKMNPLRALYPGNSDTLWVATGQSGLQCYTNAGYVDIPKINGPSSYTIRDIEITDKKVVWAATSWRDAGGFVERFQDGGWTSFDEHDKLPPNSTTVALLYDSRGILWGGTFGNGLYILNDNGTAEKKDDTVTLIDPDMEVILPIVKNFVVCPDIAEDKHGYIWVAGWDTGAYVIEGETPINEYKNHHFTFNDNTTQHIITNLCADDNGWVWLGTWDTGLIGLYIGDDPFSTFDDRTRYITPNELLSSRVQLLYADKDGYVWVGTDGGLNRIRKISGIDLEIEDMSSLFKGGLVDVKSIVIDKFNNKWIGTSNGLVKVNSRDEFVQWYTEETSGLLSNDVLSLKYDDDTDILWIGTDMGLNKFSALGDKSQNRDDTVHVYPNPFEIWGFNSKAVFTNLKPNKSVKIYTFTGELLNELVAGDGNENGGAAVVWNGRNIKGEYVGSGVFFFTGTDSRGREFKEKLVVMRK